MHFKHLVYIINERNAMEHFESKCMDTGDVLVESAGHVRALCQKFFAAVGKPYRIERVVTSLHERDNGVTEVIATIHLDYKVAA